MVKNSWADTIQKCYKTALNPDHWGGRVRKSGLVVFARGLTAECVDYGYLDHVLRSTESQYGKTLPAAHLSKDLRFGKGLSFIRGGGLRACS